MKRIFLFGVLAVAMVPAESKACGLLDALREAREARRERVRSFFGGCGSSSARCGSSAEIPTAVPFSAPEVKQAGFLRAEAPAVPVQALPPICADGSCKTAPRTFRVISVR